MNLSMQYSSMNRLGEAAACYERSLAFDKENMVCFRLGGIRYRRGEYRTAVLHLEKSRMPNASFLSSALAIGFAFIRFGDCRAAESSFQEVPRNAPPLRG